MRKSQADEWIENSSLPPKGLLAMFDDDIVGREGEIGYYGGWFDICDCEGNCKKFYCEELPHRSGGPTLYSSEKARKEILQYLKSKGYRFSPSEDETKFRLGQFDDVDDDNVFYIVK